jgi:hypothetical protein
MPPKSLKIGVTYPGRYRVVDTLSRETSLGGYPSPPTRIPLGTPVFMPKSVCRQTQLLLEDLAITARSMGKSLLALKECI